MRIDPYHTYGHTPLFSILLENPCFDRVQEEVHRARKHANTAKGNHTTRILRSFDLQHEGFQDAYGIIVRDGGGATASQIHWHRMPTSHVGVAWWTKGSTRWVRVWGKRANASIGPEEERTRLSGAFDRPPRSSDVEAFEGWPIWKMVFPERWETWTAKRRELLIGRICHFGIHRTEAEEIADLSPRIVDHVPRLGILLKDHRRTPRHIHLIHDPGDDPHPRCLALTRRFINPNDRVYKGCTSSGERLMRLLEYARTR